MHSARRFIASCRDYTLSKLFFLLNGGYNLLLHVQLVPMFNLLETLQAQHRAELIRSANLDLLILFTTLLRLIKLFSPLFLFWYVN